MSNEAVKRPQEEDKGVVKGHETVAGRREAILRNVQPVQSSAVRSSECTEARRLNRQHFTSPSSGATRGAETRVLEKLFLLATLAHSSHTTHSGSLVTKSLSW